MSTIIHQPDRPVAGKKQPTDRKPPKPIPSNRTPQEFYAEMIQRPDVRAILEELAKE